jgi:DNA processing protein
MVCSPCLRRSAVLAAVAPVIAQLGLRQYSLLSLLGGSVDELLDAAEVKYPRAFLRGLDLPALTGSVPTALCTHDAGYPRALRELPNAPSVLYATCGAERLRELLSSPTGPTVAIVGTRGLTPYTAQVTFALARDLAHAGVTVVSGVNEGPESVAHKGALDGGAATIAVMACSPDLSHLSRYDSLHRRILARGVGVSEFPPGFFEHQRWCFIASQRILAALADVIVIVDAGGFSLAALTSQLATDLGRDIAVVPCRLTDPGGQRMLRLLRDGVRPVANAEDVLHVLDDAGARGPALPDPTISGPVLHDPTISGPALHGGGCPSICVGGGLMVQLGSRSPK